MDSPVACILWVRKLEDDRDQRLQDWWWSNPSEESYVMSLYGKQADDAVKPPKEPPRPGEMPANKVCEGLHTTHSTKDWAMNYVYHH